MKGIGKIEEERRVESKGRGVIVVIVEVRNGRNGAKKLWVWVVIESIGEVDRDC